jgi:hypothetical protein
MENEELQPVSRSILAKLGVSAISNIAGGAFLFIMTIGARVRFLAIGLSVAALVIGFSALLSRDREDKRAGFFIVAAGVLGLLVQFGLPFMRPIAATILGFSALGFLAAGIWKGIRFLFGLKKMKAGEEDYITRN